MATNFDNALILTDAEKEMIGNAIYEEKKNNPDMSWSKVAEVARKLMPADRQLPRTFYPTNYPWLKRMLKRLGEENGYDVLQIQRRGTAKLSPADQKKFAAICYALRKSQPGTGWNAIFREAGKSFGGVYDRCDSPNQIRWLKPMLDQLAAEDQAPAQPAPVVAPKPDAVVTQVIKSNVNHAPDEPLPEPDMIIAPEPESSAPPSGMVTLETALINAIVGTVTPMIMGILQSPEFSAALRQAFVQAPVMPTFASVIPSVPSAPREIKPKVLVVGLLPQQAQEIQMLYGKRYDLRIFDSNVTSDKIRSLMPHCDRAIVMTKFISHRVQDVLRGHPGFTHCNGSVAALKELLNIRNEH